MARISALGFRASLSAALSSAAGPNALLQLEPPEDVAHLDFVLNGDLTTDCLPEGTHTTVLSIEHPMGQELVEVRVTGTMVQLVERGVQGTQIMNHPAGACVRYVGLPDSPCDRVADLCASEPARTALVECITPQLIEKFRDDPELPGVIVESVCATQDLQNELAACLHPELIAAAVANSASMQALATAIIAQLSVQNEVALSDKIADNVVAAICANQAVQNTLTQCIAGEIVFAISQEAGALAALRSLTNGGLTPAAIVGTICNDPNWRQALANCIALNLASFYAQDPTSRDVMRAAIVSVVGGTGLSRNQIGQISFAYSSPHMVDAICTDATSRAVLANCLRPHLNIPAASQGQILQFTTQCQALGSGITPVPLIHVRIPDPNVAMANVGLLNVQGSFGLPNLVFQPIELAPMGDGSRIVRFFNNGGWPATTRGVGVARFEAAGVSYGGIVQFEACGFSDDTSGGGGGA